MATPMMLKLTVPSDICVKHSLLKKLETSPPDSINLDRFMDYASDPPKANEAFDRGVLLSCGCFEALQD
jgi:hypothetical protein